MTEYPIYEVKIWRWDIEKEEYIPDIIFSSNARDEAEEVFDKIISDIDTPQVDLWEVTEEGYERLDIKEV